MRRGSSIEKAGSPMGPGEHIMWVLSIPSCTVWGWEGPQSEQGTFVHTIPGASRGPLLPIPTYSHLMSWRPFHPWHCLSLLPAPSHQHSPSCPHAPIQQGRCQV